MPNGHSYDAGEQVAHNLQCARAIHEECACSCGGAKHGWYRAIELARQQNSTEREKFRTKVDREWASCDGKPGREKKASKASIDTAVADLVDWLALHESVTNRVSSIGDVLGDGVARKLEDALGRDGMERLKRSSFDHFWCDLVAACCCAIGRYMWWHKSACEAATQAIFRSRRRDQRDQRSPIEEAVIKLAVQTAWKMIPATMPGLSLEHVEDLLWAMRILAILLCPAPEQHEEVAKCCLDPIIARARSAMKAAITSNTKERLLQALPPDWLLDTQISLYM